MNPLVDEEDQRWQHILWRSDPTQPLCDYSLATVTYGLFCAPWLALRVFLELAKLYRDLYPLASRAIERHSYVDDIYFGAHTLAEASDAMKQLIQLLNAK